MTGATGSASDPSTPTRVDQSTTTVTTVTTSGASTTTSTTATTTTASTTTSTTSTTSTGPAGGSDPGSPVELPVPSTTSTVVGGAEAPADLVEALSADELQGRDNGSPGSAAARELMVDALSEFADPVVDGFEIPFGSGGGIAGTNVVAIVEGAERPDEYVLLSAHYDHVAIGGAGCVASPGDDVCNGAADNATGAAAAIEVARRLASAGTGRSVVIGLWDAEEDGLVGSRRFVADPPISLDDVVAVVNMDILGDVLLPSLELTTIAIGADTGGAELTALVDELADRSELELVTLSGVFARGRSDHAPFVDAGIPAVFLSDLTNGCYHTVDDEFERLDLDKYASQLDLLTDLTGELSSGGLTPSYEPAAVSYEDALSVAELMRGAEQDLDRFGARAGEVERAIAVVESIVADGAAAFDGTSAARLLGVASQLIDALTDTPCD